MTRLVLIPATTADGRHVILRAVAVTPMQQLRRFVSSLIAPLRRR